MNSTAVLQSKERVSCWEVGLELVLFLLCPVRPPQLVKQLCPQLQHLLGGCTLLRNSQLFECPAKSRQCECQMCRAPTSFPFTVYARAHMRYRSGKHLNYNAPLARKQNGSNPRKTASLLGERHLPCRVSMYPCKEYCHLSCLHCCASSCRPSKSRMELPCKCNHCVHYT